MNDKYPAKITMYVGEAHKGTSFTEMEYNPYEHTVIFKEEGGDEIWLEVEAMDKFIEEATEFVKALNKLGIVTREIDEN